MIQKLRLYPPHKIDISYSNLLSALLPHNQSANSQFQNSPHCGDETGDVYYSVRSAWDAFLTAKSFPEGSEVILSAINIPHMAEIVKLHGLRPVFADIDRETLLPTLSEIKSKQTKRTVAVLCAHLFGNWSSLAELSSWCQAQGLILIEDCAQCFMGKDFAGTSGAELTLFSFGTIKRSTALGGGVAFVRSLELRQKMLAVQNGYPQANASRYRKKALKIALLKFFCQPFMYAYLVGLIKLLGGNPERVLRDSVRGFKEASLLPALRFSPHPKLSAAVFRSWNKSRQQEWLNRSENIFRTNHQHYKLRTQIAGQGAQLQTHWLIPLVCDQPDDLRSMLRKAQLDATQGITSLSSLAGRETNTAASLLERIVYYPITH